MDMKTLVKINLLGIVMMLMFSCAPTSKEKYMERLQSFIEEVSLEHKTYTPEDWAKIDEKYEKFAGEWYQKFESELTFTEELKVQKHKLKYAFYKALSEGKTTLDELMQSVDVEGIKKDIDNTAKDIKDTAEEFVNSIDLDEVKKDMEELGEEIINASEDVGKTIDSLAVEWVN